jgi:hypothetical protein
MRAILSVLLHRFDFVASASRGQDLPPERHRITLRPQGWAFVRSLRSLCRLPRIWHTSAVFCGTLLVSVVEHRVACRFTRILS